MNNVLQREKILFVITKSNWGGAQRYVYDLATSLNKNEFDVEVIVGGNGTLKQKLEEAHITVTSLPSMERDVHLKKEILSIIHLWKIFREKKPDTVHLNSSKAGAIGAVVARMVGIKKIIFTAHAWAFNENRSFLSRVIIGSLHWVTVFFSHTTIAVSQSVKKQVDHLPFIKNKIKVIYPGIQPFDQKNREDSRNFLRQALGKETEEKTDEKIWVGTIAELHPVKGLSYYLESIRLLKGKYPNTTFYIIGEGSERRVLEKEIEEKELKDNVFITGFIDNAKTYLKAFDIFVLPSLSEAFGYVIGEAGLANIPVVATSVGGIPEIIEDKVSGLLVPPKNPEKMAEAIEIYINKPELREIYSMELERKVLKEFNLNQMVQETLKLYR